MRPRARLADDVDRDVERPVDFGCRVDCGAHVREVTRVALERAAGVAGGLRGLLRGAGVDVEAGDDRARRRERGHARAADARAGARDEHVLAGQSEIGRRSVGHGIRLRRGRHCNEK